MKKPILLKNGVQLTGIDALTAQVRLRSMLSAAEIAASQALIDRVGQVSQWGIPVEISGSQTNKQDNFNFKNAADVLPRAEDYISVRFRALSKAIVPGHWIDWSKGDVLKQSAAKLLGQTVYPNHDFTDINNWLGSVSSVAWDEAGAEAEGVPGINAEYKIDALMNPRIARGLLMQPPAIHSTSMTVLFKFEYSHPEIAAENKYRFFDLLGEEVEGHIVRLVVTEILEYWEASLVFQGADRLAKKQEEESFSIEDPEEDPASLSAAPTAGDDPAAEEIPPPNSNEERTMKLTAEQKAELGIEFDGDDVPETEILKAAETLSAKLKGVDTVNIAELTKRAEAGDKFVEKQRAEVTRLAKIAELGAEEGELEEVIGQQITAADFDTLAKLETYYQKKAADKFPESRRSSEEGSGEVEKAGGVQQQKKPAVKVGLH